MAIDDAEKRKSISGIGYAGLMPGVTPNSGQDQEWRQQSAYSYSGILAGGPAPVVPEQHRGFMKFRATRFGGRRFS